MSPDKPNNFIASLWRSALRSRRLVLQLVKSGLFLLLLMLVLGAVGMQFSSSPRFCVTCHYMQPYYDSWKHSSHSEVKCVECHFPPGLHSEVGKKFQALVQVAKYVTRQYGTRAWTQVDDASCLRPGCHQTRLLQGKVKFEGIEFDHMPHLSQFRQVTRLRCTSCHSQLVQGKHMTVTKDTCNLCHFKSNVVKDGETNCTTCHRFPLPKGKFDHTFVQQRGIDCQECHANVTHGEGSVPRDRCVLCHAQPEHTERYSDVAFVHENHVTEHKIECSQCHDTVQHYIKREQTHTASSVKTVGACGTCHQSRHDAVALFYAGQGGSGVTGEHPDPMFEAGVTCEACHRTHENKDGTRQSHAGAGGCMLCHNEGYGAKLAQWRAEFGTPVTRLHASVVKARAFVGKSADNLQAQALADHAVKNVTLVRDAGGVHNPEYARQLMGLAAQQANEALALAGSTYRVQSPVRQTGTVDNTCASCHSEALSEGKQVFGTSFSHARHIDAKLACTECHNRIGAGKKEHGRLTFGAEGCRRCHAQRASSPHPAKWVAQHGGKAKKNSAECAVCHEPKQCASCHGTAMPHPKTWTAQHGKQARANDKSCDRCHTRSECTTCHTTRNPHQSGWVKRHGKQAGTASANCRMCHTPSSCRECHTDAQSAHKADWRKAHVTRSGDEQQCALCHTQSKGKNTCTSCHGVKMPHSDDYAMEHAKEASFEKDSACFRCHDRAKDCSECHE